MCVYGQRIMRTPSVPSTREGHESMTALSRANRQQKTKSLMHRDYWAYLPTGWGIFFDSLYSILCTP